MPSSAIEIQPLKSCNPDPSNAKAHHIGSPPTSFKNPWPSYADPTRKTLFQKRFGSDPEKNFIPVPEGTDGARSDELVKVRSPDWGVHHPDRLRATWIGHASFLIETPVPPGAQRGLRILFDPLFSERTSPFSFLGPKRYTPTPCTVHELPEVDLVCISHNHYDHLDYQAVCDLYQRRKEGIHFFVPLNGKKWFTTHICPAEQVTEMDWWERCEISVAGVGRVVLTATPSQHGSMRTPFDKNCALWCSWCIETTSYAGGRKLFFAGDTGYQAATAKAPCPIFPQIGGEIGPFDLALLPIGLFKPQGTSGGNHVSPEQALRIHAEVRAKLSIGMHYGTVRGGVSGLYEDVREPPRRWREAAEKEGLWRGGGVEGTGESVDSGGEGVGLCDIGETVAI